MLLFYLHMHAGPADLSTVSAAKTIQKTLKDKVWKMHQTGFDSRLKTHLLTYAKKWMYVFKISYEITNGLKHWVYSM